MSENDEIERKIVDLLMEDGRMPASEIARRLGDGTSERVIRYRIDRLIKENIISLTAVVNPKSPATETSAITGYHFK